MKFLRSPAAGYLRTALVLAATIVACPANPLVANPLPAASQSHSAKTVRELLNRIKRGNSRADQAIAAAALTALINEDNAEGADTRAGLAAALADKDKDIREAAAFSFNSLTLDTVMPDAANSLIHVLDDTERDVRWAAIFSLGYIGATYDATVPKLIAILQGRDEALKPVTADALGALGIVAAPAVPALVATLGDADTGLRISVASALGNIGRESSPAIPKLIPLLKDPDPIVRASTARAMDQIDQNTRIAVLPLIAALSDSESNVRVSAATALSDILRSYGSQGSSTTKVDIPDDIGEAGKALSRAIDDSSKTVRIAAITASYLADQSSEVAQKLLELLKEEHDPDVRAAAINALPQFQGAANSELTGLILQAFKSPDPAVRAAAARLSVNFYGSGKAAVSALTENLKDPDPKVRQATAMALGMMGSIGAPAIPSLTVALRDPDPGVAQEATMALGAVGIPSEAMPEISKILRQGGKEARAAAASALARSTTDLTSAVPELAGALNGAEPETQQLILTAIQRSRAQAAPVVPTIIDLFKTSRSPFVRAAAMAAIGTAGVDDDTTIQTAMTALSDADKATRLSAVTALGQLAHVSHPAGPTPEQMRALDAVIARLKDTDPEMRAAAAGALGSIRSPSVVGRLAEALQDDDANTRLAAETSLAQSPDGVRRAVPYLLKSLSDPDQTVRLNAANGIVVAIQTAADNKITGEYEDFVKAQTTLRSSSDSTLNYYASQMDRYLAELNPLSGTIATVAAALDKHPAIAASLAAVIIWILFCGIIYVFSPLTVLKISESLAALTVKLPDWVGIGTAPLRYVLLIGFLAYRPRVLDAWIACNIETVRRRFGGKDTVAGRRAFVPLPVVFNGEVIPELGLASLRQLFKPALSYLLIWGEGGSGKTSLACRIAELGLVEDPDERLRPHLMLPVLIEQDLSPATDDALFEAIRRQIQDLTDTAEDIPPDRIKALLRHRRILVIIDHMSEMGEATREHIKLKTASFLANTLIVTSRIEESLGIATKAVIEPLRVEGNRLSSFIEAYLTQFNKRSLFNDAEFFEMCQSLSAMVGERPITVLLAKLYAEQRVATQSGDHSDEIPKTIPSLMLTYINRLNMTVANGRLPNDAVHRDAKLIAWKCLEENFAPRATARAEILRYMTGADAQQRLDYLETRLNLIAGVEPAELRFQLDPLAEYLAAMYLLDNNRPTKDKWNPILARAGKAVDKGLPISGFLLALKDCCAARRETAHAAGNVPEAAGLEFVETGVSKLSESVSSPRRAPVAA